MQHGDEEDDILSEDRELDWMGRCQWEWNARCHAAVSLGIRVGRSVPGTVDNRRRLAKAEAAAAFSAPELRKQRDQDLLPSRWQVEYTDGPTLDREMRDRMGLTEGEREVLWMDGVETVAWLQRLRPEDYMESGVDVLARQEQLGAQQLAETAWEAKCRAEQHADPASLEAEETVYFEEHEDEFAWLPVDDERHFARAGRKLDARRRAQRH